MNKGKIIKKFAMIFGIIFIVFTVLAAILNYEYNKVFYTSAAPASLFIYSSVIAMLPYLVVAIVLFVLAFFSPSAAKSEAEKEPEAQEEETQKEETPADLEDVFKETPT